uniref:Zinc finger protein 804A n=1 Tax=Cyprinus carpio TaxID=7962 RepID=A0A8C2GW65_CYPCA
MACYYIVISSTHLSNGYFRNIKGVFRGPLSKNGNKNLDYAEKEKTLAKALEDLKANFYCQLCDKQYYKHQEFDNHINSYDHAHKQRLKELKQREFARNVASKSRKDERKQERALRRLHELAEQRREVQCAPGSGPMFKSTTVAVEGSFRESCYDDAQEEIQSCAAQDPGGQIHSSSCGLASKQSPWPYNGRAKKQTFRRKIAFSFSFPKKASVKLESSAAVFCESMEEGSMERSRRQRLRAPPVELDLPGSPTEEKVLNCEEAVYSTGIQQGKHFQKCDNDVSQRSSDMPVVRESPSSTASDLCALLVYSEDVPSPAVSLLNTSPFCLNRADIVLDSEDTVESLKSNIAESKPETSEDVTVEKSGISEEGHSTFSESPEKTDVSPKNDSLQQQEQVEDATAKTPYHFTKPSQPFFSVLSRDGNTIFQWPSEMVTFTRTEPSLSFSCNPLHFDFKRPRIRRSADTQEMTEPRTDEELSVCSGFKSCHSDKHIEEFTANPRDSPIQGMVRKCYQYSSDTESCVRLKTHDRCRHSKDWIHTSKRAEEKLRARDRRHYRTPCKRKRRRRKRRRDRHRETESNMVKSKKFYRQPECVEGIKSQFRGTTSQQEHPLEKSKQSAQNQAEDSSTAPVVEEGVGGRRQDAAADINGSAGCIIPSDEFCADGEKVLGNSREKPDNPTAGKLTTTGQCSHNQDASHSQKSSATKGCREETPTSPETNRDGPCEGQTLKRRHTDSLSERDESYNPPQSPGEISYGCKELTCCEYGMRRKRQRPSHVQDQTPCLANECSIVTNSVLEEDKAVEESSMKCLVLNGACDSLTGSDQISCSIDDGDSSAVDPQTFTSISSALGHTVEESSEWQQSSSSQINASCTKGSLTLLETDSKLLKEPTKENSNIHSSESKAAQTPLKICNKYSVAAQACLLDVRELALQRTEKATHDKSCQHSLQIPPPRFHLGVQAEEKLSRECFHTTSLFQPSPSFQTPSNSMERRCLLQMQIQSHGQVLHQQVFPTKVKSVLPRPHLPMSSAVLHPVHLPSSMPSGSITIRHTILQHHTAFLPPQHPIYPQLVSVSRLPLGPEICRHTAPNFMTPSAVAPPSIHPMTVMFHALPRPAVFPPMLPPHSAVIPLQPLF